MIFKNTETVQTDLDNATLITMKNGDGTDATVKNSDGSTSIDERPVNIKVRIFRIYDDIVVP